MRVSRYSGFGDSDEARATEQLLDAVNQGDETAGEAILNSPIFKYLENDVSQRSYLRSQL